LVYPVVGGTIHDAHIETPEACARYAVLDPLGQKIGTVEELFVNGRGKPAYVRVRMGPFGLRSALIPVQTVAMNRERRTLVLQ
jgi:hypothetical protein